jgi:parvulin-like peptidyl-prolyl isomerase
VIRDVAATLEPGAIGGPITLEGGFAILRCERKIPASATGLAEVEAALRRGVRLRAQNAAMQRRVRVMIEEAQVTILDGDLDAAWKRQRDKALANP